MRSCFKVLFLTLGYAALEFAARALALGLGAESSFNRGVALGLLAGRPGAALGLSAAAFAVILAGALFLRGERLRLGLSLTAGGAAANLAERLARGGVTDWIPLPLSGWLAEGGLRFNLADAEIGLGALIVLAAIAGAARTPSPRP